jgi:hypothetical protein
MLSLRNSSILWVSEPKHINGRRSRNISILNAMQNNMKSQRRKLSLTISDTLIKNPLWRIEIMIMGEIPKIKRRKPGRRIF